MSESGELERIEDLFQRAADLAPARRRAFLARECADDGGLRERVQRMLGSLERGESLAPAVPPSNAPSVLTEGPGARIGRYKLLQLIGEGGFGVVYLAEQEAPVVRKVALKIIRLGMDTKEVVARFEAERQALALMDHPNIAKVLDGGATETGRPYFVMELVRGVSITEYCDQNRLGTEARLALFAQVCHAVQHAHQKGVLHRDLKPSNVMVTLHDGRPVPKVIDFGIAKAMHSRLTEKTLFTQYQRFIGTPAYMSPEQAEMSGLDVDTRSDVYSLGVLLYELLTGSTPFDTTQLLEAGLGEVQRVLREEEPPRPSMRISTTADAALAAQRRLDVQGLSRQVRGDLDWIVMKALEKDRTRRYGTASEFAADVDRHLRDEPVLAGPPSATYRMRKFLVRNRAGVAWGGFVLLAMLAGIVGTGVAMFEAERQRDEAQREAARALAVTDFLVDTLALSDPAVALRSDVSVRVLLDLAAADVEEAFAGQPRSEARIRGTIGRAYESLGRQEPAEVHLRRAVELAASVEDYDAADLYTTLWSLTHVLFVLEKPDALATAMEARRVGLGHIRRSRPELADALDAFLFAAEEAAHSSEAASMDLVAPLFERSVELSEEVLPHGDPLWPIVADSYMHAGYTLWYSSHEAHSAAYWERALEIQRRELAPNDPAIADSLGQLVVVLNRAGRAAEADARIRTTVELMRQVYPQGSFQLSFLESMLGENLVRQGRYAEAEPYLLEGHAGLVAALGSEQMFYALDSSSRLIGLYDAWERPDEADRWRKQLVGSAYRWKWAVTYPLMRAALGGHPELLGKADRLAEICGNVTYTISSGTVTDPALEPAVREFLALRRQLVDDTDPLAVCIARQLYLWSTHLSGAEVVAETLLLDEALAVLAPHADAIPLDLGEACAARAELAAIGGERVRADALADAAIEHMRADTTDDDYIEASIKARTGRSLLQLGRYAQAEELLLPSYDALGRQLGREYRDTREVRALLHQLYLAWGRPDDAREFAPQ